MNVTRAQQGRPQGDDTPEFRLPTRSVRPEVEVLEQARVRIRAAQGAVGQARAAGAAAVEAKADAELLRRRLPVAITGAELAMQAVRVLRGMSPETLWHAGRRSLAAERARRAVRLSTALAERDELVARIADLESRARKLRAESLRHRAAAAALPRLLDQAADCLRRSGGPAAEALAAAEAGLEPVLRRESELDEAVRWVTWAQAHVDDALERLRSAGPGAVADPFGLPCGERDGRTGAEDGPAGGGAGARIVLGEVRDVFGALCRALDDLGVHRDELAVPQLPDDLLPWFEGTAPDQGGQQQVTAALASCGPAVTGLADLLLRLRSDHATTRKVLQSRRAHWCALLRGE